MVEGHMIRRTVSILAMLVATPASCTEQANAAPAKHCTSAEYRQFDFWVGSWDVYPTGGSQLVAHSLIESVYNGCGVRENWMPLKVENSGGSLNIYVLAEKVWRQTWIDSSGARVDFKGGLIGRARARNTRWRCARWPISGYASSSQPGARARSTIGRCSWPRNEPM